MLPRNLTMRLAVLTAAFVLVAALVSQAVAGEPTDVLKGRVDKILELLKTQEYKQADSAAQRKMIRSRLEDFFDKEELAKRTLAVHWKNFSQPQREEFIRLFTDLLERTYIERIQGYRDEKVLYTGEKIVEGKALVQTKVLHQGQEIPIDYSLLQSGGVWKIYDVNIEGVSLVKNYRTQFHDILASGKPENLLAKLREKIAKADQGDTSDKL